MHTDTEGFDFFVGLPPGSEHCSEEGQPTSWANIDRYQTRTISSSELFVYISSMGIVAFLIGLVQPDKLQDIRASGRRAPRSRACYCTSSIASVATG